MTDTTIVIRSCRADMTSSGGFVWPTSGHVEAPDWEPSPECEHGLHGLRAGDNCPATWSKYGHYLALAVPTESIVPLAGKCKFPEAEVLHVAESMVDLSAWLQGRGHIGPWYRGHATAGDYGHATAGKYGHATAGDKGCATAGDYGTASVGWGGHAVAGWRGTASAGVDGVALAGYCGMASAGRRGQASVRWLGTASVGEGGVIIIRDIDDNSFVGIVGKDGLKPDTPYHLEAGKFVEGKDPEL